MRLPWRVVEKKIESMKNRLQYLSAGGAGGVFGIGGTDRIGGTDARTNGASGTDRTRDVSDSRVIRPVLTDLCRALISKMNISSLFTVSNEN